MDCSVKRSSAGLASDDDAAVSMEPNCRLGSSLQGEPPARSAIPVLNEPLPGSVVAHDFRLMVGGVDGAIGRRYHGETAPV
jgi:hypothetical protein